MHCMNWLTLHDGNGKCCYVHGGEPGRINDIELLRRSEFYQNINDYICIDTDAVLCDGTWMHEGEPFLTRFHGTEYLTYPELAFNLSLSECRVICENYYCKLHQLWPILNLWKYRLDKLNIFFRACVLMTNIIIEHQSPLR